ncbi:hypothetical protein PMAYCL1PPCAC_14539, partial [Pristionchus mayeri]
RETDLKNQVDSERRRARESADQFKRQLAQYEGGKRQGETAADAVAAVEINTAIHTTFHPGNILLLIGSSMRAGK